MSITVYHMTSEEISLYSMDGITLSGYEDLTGSWVLIDTTSQSGDVAAWMFYNTKNNGIYRIVDWLKRNDIVVVHVRLISADDPSYYIWKRDLDQIMSEFISPKDE